MVINSLFDFCGFNFIKCLLNLGIASKDHCFVKKLHEQ
jgi:hypothetical protein